jgi:ubiquinone/menaquinone biosynthesis C-methylase UbiE
MTRFSQSRLAALMQHSVSKRREEVGLYAEIAEKLPPIEQGRVLDVGTGSGLQLKVINERSPYLELYGLDVSEQSIRIAAKNLQAIQVDLRVGGIEHTSYEHDFFDIITCNASMSYWKNPIACFDEIFRILKPGRSAHLFEPQRDFDLDETLEIIRANLADRSWLRRWAATSLNRFGLRHGSRLGMKLYSVEELEELTRRSRFGDSFSIERTTIQNLPIFVQIRLIKP